MTVECYGFIVRGTLRRHRGSYPSGSWGTRLYDGCPARRLRYPESKRDGEKFTVEKVFAGKDIANHLGGVVLSQNYVYGCSGDTSQAKWTCQELHTGKVLWSNPDRKLGKGSLIYADGRLYCFGEKKGLVALAEASPKGWKITGQFTLPRNRNCGCRGDFWTQPVVANGRLYLRDQDLLFCYDVKGK